MKIKRVFRHLFSTHWRVKNAFPQTVRTTIENQIQASEILHGGELRFVVENAFSGLPLLHDLSSRERAIDVFSQLRMWDTEERSGVLIYLLMADRSVEIIADRGVDAKVGAQQWKRICRDMESAFHRANYEQGILDGINAINQLLILHFPTQNARPNQLSNKVILL